MDELAAIVERHGWAVQAVLADGPGSPPFAYTVGLHDRTPELLLVGACSVHAQRTLNQAAGQLTRQPQLARAGTYLELTDDLPWERVLLGEVAPVWAGTYAIAAAAYHRVDEPGGVPMLQVLLPDQDGRFPGDVEVADELLRQQPVLADPDQPWLLPHGTKMLDLIEEDGGAADQLLLLPIMDRGAPAGRDELVTTRRVGDGVWEVTAQPTLADWCSIDTTVRASPVDRPVRGTRGAQVVRFEEVVQESPMVPLRWELRLGEGHGRDAHGHGRGGNGHGHGGGGDLDADVDRLHRTLTHPRFGAQVAIGTGAVPHAITAAVPPRLAEPLRLAMRRLERDGLVVPLQLFHRPEDRDLAPPDARCACCRTGRS